MSNKTERGFTVLELLVTMTITAILSTIVLQVFVGTFSAYMKLQKESSALSQLSFQSNRVTNVLRSTISIESANDNDITLYAYFYPSDAYASKVKYYVQTNGSTKSLVADLTPMTANPPTGTTIDAKKKTVTIVNNLTIPQSGKLFTYLNAGNGVIAAPVTDTSIIKSIKLSLGISVDKTTVQNMDVQIVIRNRKNNL